MTLQRLTNGQVKVKSMTTHERYVIKKATDTWYRSGSFFNLAHLADCKAHGVEVSWHLATMRLTDLFAE